MPGARSVSGAALRTALLVLLAATPAAVEPLVRLTGLESRYCPMVHTVSLSAENASSETLSVSASVQCKDDDGAWSEVIADVSASDSTSKFVQVWHVRPGKSRVIHWRPGDQTGGKPLAEGEYRIVLHARGIDSSTVVRVHGPPLTVTSRACLPR